MDPFVVLSIQATLSLIVFALIAVRYVLPGLSDLTLTNSLMPLLLVHTFRYAPLTLFVPGHVSTDIPTAAAATIAYGDLLSGILALISVLLLWRNVTGAVWFALAFNIIGMLDIVNALMVAIQNNLYQYLSGVNWYIITFYVPLLIVTHIMMFYLIRTERTYKTALRKSE